MRKSTNVFWCSSGIPALALVVFFSLGASALNLRSSLHAHGCEAPPPRDLPAVAGPVHTVIIILGGPTQGLKPGPWLEWRLRVAIKLHQQHSPDTTAFLVTGGRPKTYDSCGAYSEAAVMQRWLENAGITKGVWREDRSNHTLDNAELTRSRLEALKNEGVVAHDASLHIVTQPWHMVKASECFRVFFARSSFQAHYESISAFPDDTMVPFEQEGYAEMYRAQLQTWLPWQLGFSQAISGSSSAASAIIGTYISSLVLGFGHPFFQDGRKAATDGGLAWSRINDLQWHMFKQTLMQTSGDGFVPTSSFSKWGSLNGGQAPRYVTAFNSRRDSGDFVGLSCPGHCGKSYNGLRVVAFLHHPSTRTEQLEVLRVAQAWAETADEFSPHHVAMYALKHDRARPNCNVSFPEVEARLKLWSESPLSKMLDTSALQAIAAR